MTKDEIVKALRACGRRSCGDCPYCKRLGCDTMSFDAADLIEQQAARIAELEAKVPRWIPVTDRLPEVEGKYIVCTAHGSVTTVRFDPVLGRFQRIFTHWMRYPKPPQEETA